MDSDQIRRRFLEFFAAREHRVVRSSPLIPHGDPTLLFTNAGMNQFKDVFLGLDQRDYSRAASSQKCVRAGGKHNDLEVVGHTESHLTFFEMLGNFSFGDYFKAEAIDWAWELLTVDFGLDPERLHASVFEEDDEAYQLWRERIGIPAERLWRLGAKDNFWAMGDTGPCGPCSEIHIDRGGGCGRPECDPSCDCSRFVELWNLVFMQFSRGEDGVMKPLPRPSIDTGMGLERISMVLQDVGSVFETDLLMPLVEAAAGRCGSRYGADPQHDVALRVVADHLRSTCFLLADGVMPSNDGRGYVLRRILRRAVRYALKLGLKDPVLHELTPLLVERMGGAFPELVETRDYIQRVVRLEEERFHKTLAYSGKVLEEVVARVREQGGEQLPGEDVFRLYDTYGLPVDVLQELAEDHGLGVDREGFERLLESSRERQRRTWKGGAAEETPRVYRQLLERSATRFVGYRQLEQEGCRVLAVLQDGHEVQSLSAPASGEVVLDRTPFYAEGGGQVGDRGVLLGPQLRALVEDTRSPVRGLVTHRVRVLEGRLGPEDHVTARVEESTRRRTATNHSATHLLHAALRQVLGDHVKQAGSLVAPDRLRFDFAHFGRVEPDEVERIETLVNEQVAANHDVKTETKSMDTALAEGALAFFGDRYADDVRVVSMGDFSKELCGGTHLAHTGSVGFFTLASEQGIAAGVRRVEALTGEAAVVEAVRQRRRVEELSERLHATPGELVDAVDRLQGDLKQARRELAELRLRLAQAPSGTQQAAEEWREVRGVKLATRLVEGLDQGSQRQLADELRKRLGSGVVVLGSRREDKASLLVAVTPDLTDRLPAQLLARQLAERLGGRGGGRPDMAQAGGPHAERLEAVLEAADGVVESLLEQASS